MRLIGFEIQKITRETHIDLVFAFILIANFCLVGLNGLITFRQDMDSGITLQNYTELAHYKEHLDALVYDIDRQQSISLFSSSSGLSSENLRLGEASYRALYAQDVRAELLGEVSICTDQPFTGLLLLILYLYSILCFSGVESDSHMWPCLRVQRRSFLRLFISKMFCAFMTPFAALCILTFENLFIGVMIYGGHSLLQPMQQIPGYIDSPFSFTALGYLLLHALFLYLWCCGIGLIFFTICILLKHTLSSIVVLLTVGGISVIPYYAISEWSDHAALKYLSPAAGTFPENYFQSWSTVPFLGRICPAWVFVLTAFLPLIFIGLIAAFIVWMSNPSDIGNHRAARRESPANLLYKLRIPGSRFSMFETRKFLFSERAILVILLLLTAQVIQYGQKRFIADGVEHYYQEYSRPLIGRFTQKTAESILQLSDGPALSSDDISALDTALANDDISESYYQWRMEKDERTSEMKSAIERMNQQCARLSNEVLRGNTVEYMPQTVWDMWFGDTGENLLDDLKLLAALALGLHQLFSFERKNNMTFLICSRRDSLKKVHTRKKHIVVFYTATCAILAYLPRFLWVVRSFSLEGWMGHSRSLQVLSWMPCNLPLWLCILIWYTSRIGIGVGAASSLWMIGLHKEATEPAAIE